MHPADVVILAVLAVGCLTAMLELARGGPRLLFAASWMAFLAVGMLLALRACSYFGLL